MSSPIDRAQGAVVDVLTQITRASTAARHAASSPVAEIPAALDAVQNALELAYEATRYIDAELNAAAADRRAS